MKLSLCVFMILLGILIYPLKGVEGSYTVNTPEVSTPTKGDSFSVAIEGGDLLSVDIRDAALGEVLQHISDKNGIIFSIPPSLAQDKVMVRFSRFKVDEGLNKILTSYNRIFIYSKTSDDTSNSTGLTEVRIYPRLQEQGKKSKETPLVIHPGVSLSSPVTTEHTEDASQGASVKNPPRDRGSMVKLEDYSKALQDRNPKRRIDAGKTLGWAGDENVLGTLSKALQDKDPRVKKEAEKALGEIGKSLKEQNKGEEQEEVTDPEDVMPPSEREASLSLSTGSGGGVNLELDNGVPLRAVQFTLNGAELSEIRTTPRAEGFLAKYNEKNGRVVLVSLTGQKIAPGNGPIAEIICNNTGAQLSNIKLSK